MPPPPPPPTSASGGDYEDPSSASSEERDAWYRETFARAPIGLAHVGLDGRWLRFNRRLAEILDYPTDELARLRFQDVTHPPDLAPDLRQLERLLAGEIDAYQLEKRYVRRDASLVWASLHVSLVRGADGAPRYFIAVVDDITDQKATEEALDAARTTAESANRAKSQFLATMSHEIRTPLAAILGYAELLGLGMAGPLTERQQEYLERVGRSGRHLLAIVSQILDLAKIEADRLSTRRIDANVGEAVLGALASVEPQAVTRGVRIANACGPAGSSWYAGDPDRVQQVLVNLLANAVKFTAAGGRVTVSCGTTRRPPPEAALSGDAAEWVYVRVEDTGIGVPSDRLEAIFEPFEQAEGGYTRPHEGTGLGLTISRRLARLMGGDVTARSQPGVGSMFFLWLPATRVRTPAEPIPERRTAARYTPGIGAIGHVALESLEHALAAYVARLRADPATPSAARCTDEQLEDHMVTFLADAAQGLAIIEGARGGPSELLRDGTAIQRVVSERHGALRARLGFAESELRREYAILREVLANAVRQRAEAAQAAAVEQALALLERALDHGERSALRGHREEAALGDPPGDAGAPPG